MVADLVRQVEDEIEVEELTRKFAGSTMLEQSPGEDWSEETAIDIKEEWTEEDAFAFNHRKVAHPEIKSPRAVTFKPKDTPKSKPSSAIKDRIVERKSTKLPVKDPLDVGMHRQAKESLFRQALRKSSSNDKSNETLAPPK